MPEQFVSDWTFSNKLKPVCKRPVIPQSNESGARFSKVSVTFLCIQDQSFNNFENNSMKLSVKEAKLTGLWASNCATYSTG